MQPWLLSWKLGDLNDSPLHQPDREGASVLASRGFLPASHLWNPGCEEDVDASAASLPGLAALGQDARGTKGRQGSTNRLPWKTPRVPRVCVCVYVCVRGPAVLRKADGSVKKRAHKFEQKSPGHRPSVPRTPGWDKQGSTCQCPRDFLLFYGFFWAGTPTGCPRDTRASRGFSEILWDFLLCVPFLLPNGGVRTTNFVTERR